jgi:purine-binding chemotaxis protein CheW
MNAALQMRNNTALAVAPGNPGQAIEQNQYLTFMLDGELFALGILAVKEIIEYHSLTVVPMMPDWVRGVINLRGAVVPVLDLSIRFGRRSTQVTKRTCVVIIEIAAGGERQVVGVVVDSVSQVLDIPSSEIEPPPKFGAKIGPEFIQGMGKVGGKFVILLDAEAALSPGELGELDSIEEECQVEAPLPEG